MRNRDCANQTGRRAWTLAAALGMMAFAAVLPLRLAAQIATTTVQGTVYRADGTPASGTLLISWPAFTTPQNQAVAAGSTSATIGADGFVSVNLTPNAASLPAGNYYTVVYHLNDGTVSSEYWVVPAAGTAAIASVRAQLQPSTMAVQPVSQAYVNSAIAALSATWLPLAGGTLTGPLTLNSDPTASNQAATKHYADQLAAAQLPLAGGTLTGPLTVPTLYTKQLEGRLYADQMQSGTGSNNGVAMSLQDCRTYSYACQVLAPALYAQTEALPWGGFMSAAITTPITGPKSTDPLGCVIDNRYATPQMVCNQGLPWLNTDMASWGIAQNALTMGQGNNAVNTAARIMNTQWMGALDLPVGLGTESTMQGLQIVTNDYSQANDDPLRIKGYSWSPADLVGIYEDILGVGTTLGQNEGTENRLRSGETGNVTQVTLTSAPVCGATCLMSGHQTLGQTGAFGEWLPWIDLNQSYNAGYIATIAGNDVVTGSGTNWDSTFGTSNGVTTTTANLTASSYPAANVSIPVTSSTGFTTGKAYIFDPNTGVRWQGFHITSIPDGTHIVADQLYTPMASGATVSQGGLAGYGFKMDADDVCSSSTGLYNGVDTNGADSPVITGACIHNLVPIVSNSAGNVVNLFYSGPYYDYVHFTRGYTTMGSGGNGSVTVSGGVVTACTVSGGTGYKVNGPPQLVISGITYTTAPSIYVGYTYGGAGISDCVVASGGSGISGTPVVSVVPSNPYHIYPMAESLQNYNATTGWMDASALVTMPWTGTVSVGDVVEQDHYFNYKMHDAMMNAIVNDWQYGGGEATQVILNGRMGGAEEYENPQSPSVYGGTPLGTPYIIGQGQTNFRPPAGFGLQGQFYNGLSMTLPPVEAGNSGAAAVYVGCSPYCGSWNAYYNVLDVQNANSGGTAEDGLQYNPATQTWAWTAGAAGGGGSSPACTVNLAGSSNAGLSVTCNGATSRFDSSGNLSVAGTIHAQGSVTGASINGEVTVDGTTYTTLIAAWNAALAQANSTGHNQTVRLGPGTFPVTATLNEPGNGACVSLLGSGGTTVNADSPQVATTLTVPASLGGDVFYLGNTAQAQGCTFRDLNLLAGGNATHGFELQWFRGALIDNVAVNDTTAEGILLGEETTTSGHQSNFLLRNVTVSYSSSAFTPANRSAYGIHLQKTAMDSELDNITVRNALTAAVYNEGTGNTGYLVHGFGFPYTCTTAPCANNASSGTAANASYATSYVIYDTGGSGSVWTDTYVDSPAVAGFYVGANGVAIHGGHVQWPDLTSFPAANLAYVAPAVTNNLLVADVDCLEMAAGVNWITYAGASGNPPTYASVHHLTGCGNYYQSLEDANVNGFSSGGANVNDPTGAVPRVWSTPVAAAASYPAYAAQMYTGYQGDAFQAHFSGLNPFFNITYQGTIRSSGGLALSTIVNTASTLTLTAANKNVIANAASGAQTVTLPSCYTALPDKAAPAGLEFTIIKSDTSANAVTLQTVSSQNINYNGVSAQTLAISAPGKRTLVCAPDYNWYAY
ncbi:MAG: hypothetical protein WBW84_08025 [Acidobacteriaceae bacterium]